ncbi:MAG: glycine dehydrogenase, partial [Acidimicrobiales bacterium]
MHPHWRQVLATFASGTGHHLVDVPLDDGVTRWPEPGDGGDGGMDDPPAALLVQYPNHLGCIEDLAAATEVARRHRSLLAVAADPVAAGLLRPPGQLGADVVVGEGQPFGTPLSFGGPYLGLFACRRELVRRLPGRLVGETVDADGRRAYVTT